LRGKANSISVSANSRNGGKESNTMEFLDRPDGRLAYDVHGPADGRLVVAVHGMGDRKETFRFLVPLLVDQGHRVAVLDVRGHGASSTGWPTYTPRAVGDDVLALIRHLDGGPATVLGNSSGTAAAIWAAAEAPDLVGALVLEATFLAPTRMSPLLRLVSWPILRSATLFAKVFHPSLYKAGKPADLPEYTIALRRTLAEPGRMAAVRGVMGDKEECHERVPELRCPALVVLGTADPDYPDPVAEARHAEGVLGAHTHTELLLLDGAGHYPHAELPEQTAARIGEFLAAAARA
jgi:pimeloyl-ACP methyl ester carboxylesterase